MTSSILTPSQSGIVGEGGRKVLKTRVQILGRYLLEPGEELGPELAARLVDRAKSGRGRLRTQLTLFSAGVRLGERGVFTSMPVEFIKYQRLSDLVSPARHPSVLVMGVRDYSQRCATVVQFKDDVCLRVVVDVISRHRRNLDEDVARMSDLHSLSSTMRGAAVALPTVGGGHHGGGEIEGNWHLMGSKPAEAPSSSASHSMLDDDYAIIRRSRMLASVETEDSANEEAATPAQQRWEQRQVTHRQSEEDEQQQHRQRYQKKTPQQPHHQPMMISSQNQQLQRRYLAQANETFDFEELETAAIFETPDGPPTLLNELVQRAGGGGDRVSGTGSKGSGNLRMSELPPEFVARTRVDRNSSAASSSNGERQPSATWAPLDDRLGE